MSSFKFGQIDVASKEFYKQRQITDTLKINVNSCLLIKCHAIMERTGRIL